MKTKKKSNCNKRKTQNVTTLKNSNCDQIKKKKSGWDKKSNLGITNIVTKLKLWQNSNVTKLKLWQNQKTQIGTKLELWQISIYDKHTLKGSVSKNI